MADPINFFFILFSVVLGFFGGGWGGGGDGGNNLCLLWEICYIHRKPSPFSLNPPLVIRASPEPIAPIALNWALCNLLSACQVYTSTYLGAS